MAPIDPSKSFYPVQGKPVARPQQGQEGQKGTEAARDKGFERLDFRPASRSRTELPETANPSRNNQKIAAGTAESKGFSLQTLSTIAGMFSEALQPPETIRPGAPLNEQPESADKTETGQANTEKAVEVSDSPSRPLRPGSAIDFKA